MLAPTRESKRKSEFEENTKQMNRRCIHIRGKIVQKQINRALAVQDPKIILEVTKYTSARGIDSNKTNKTKIEIKSKIRKWKSLRVDWRSRRFFG